MRIIKGGKSRENTQKFFTCENCGCEFAAEPDEYYVVSTETTLALSVENAITITCCPECHKIVKKNEYTLRSDSITSSYTYLSTPTGGDQACKPRTDMTIP